MIAVASRRAFLDRRTIWFPSPTEISVAISSMGMNTILTIRQAPAEPPAHILLVSRKQFLTVCIDLEQPLDDLWSEVRKSTRKQIKRALALGPEAEIRLNSAGCDMDFLSVFNDFAAAKGHRVPMRLREFRETRSATTDVFIVYYRNVPMVVNMLLRDKSLGRVRGLYLASTRLQGDEQSGLVSTLTRYLRWYEFQHYKASGFSVFDVGGIPGLDHPRAEFKQSFGGHVVTEHDCTYAGKMARVALEVRNLIRYARGAERA